MAKANWYVVHVHSGYELKVADSIHEQAEKKDLQKQIEEVLVPVEDVVEVKKGEKVTSQQKFYPGYVLVKMALTDDVWHMVTSIAKVTGFLGAKGRPSPVSQREVDKIMQRVKEGAESPRSTVTYEVGEKVRVVDGPFNSFSGLVEEVDDERSRLKVSVSIFGRSTPVDLDFTQVEKG